jgi:hypothetical protein
MGMGDEFPHNDTSRFQAGPFTLVYTAEKSQSFSRDLIVKAPGTIFGEECLVGGTVTPLELNALIQDLINDLGKLKKVGKKIRGMF